MKARVEEAEKKFTPYKLILNIDYPIDESQLMLVLGSWVKNVSYGGN